MRHLPRAGALAGISVWLTQSLNRTFRQPLMRLRNLIQSTLPGSNTGAARVLLQRNPPRRRLLPFLGPLKPPRSLRMDSNRRPFLNSTYGLASTRSCSCRVNSTTPPDRGTATTSTECGSRPIRRWRAERRWDRSGQGPQAILLVAGDPGVEGLAGHPEAAGHVDDRRGVWPAGARGSRRRGSGMEEVRLPAPASQRSAWRRRPSPPA